MAWYDGFAGFAKNALSETADFVSANLGTIVGGFIEAGKDQASQAVQTYLPPSSSGGTLPSYATASTGGGGSGPPGGGEGFPMATVLLLVGSVVVVALVLKK